MNFTRTDPSFFIFNIIACLFLKFYSKKYQIRKLEKNLRCAEAEKSGDSDLVHLSNLMFLVWDQTIIPHQIRFRSFYLLTTRPKNRKSRLNRKFDLCRSMHICLIWSFKQWPGLGQTPRTSLPSPGAMNPSLYSSPSTWGMAGYPPAAYAAAAAGAGAFGHFAHQPW